MKCKYRFKVNGCGFYVPYFLIDDRNEKIECFNCLQDRI